jgi:Recombinase zinc beta ribbon domain
MIRRHVWHRAEKSVTPREKRHKAYYLAGMVYCSCGFAMSGSSVGKERKQMEGLHYNYFYKCSAYSKVLGRTKCGNKAVPALELEATVWHFVERLIRDPKTTLALYQKRRPRNRSL